MTRFILLTFAFLGWTYWEMSGGADFQPGDRQLAQQQTSAGGMIAAAEAGAPEVSRAATGAAELTRISASAAQASAEPAVARTSDAAEAGGTAEVQFASFEMPAEPAPAPRPRAEEGWTQTDALALTRRDPSRALPGPSAGTRVTSTEEMTPSRDLRRVDGSRVNLRQGPGTRHSVLTQLSEGQEVEVLRQEGGWLKLRVVETSRIGWMADYLVTAAR
ncbi:SH3 domain-containing protein [Roseivivax sp.]